MGPVRHVLGTNSGTSRGALCAWRSLLGAGRELSHEAPNSCGDPCSINAPARGAAECRQALRAPLCVAPVPAAWSAQRISLHTDASTPLTPATPGLTRNEAEGGGQEPGLADCSGSFSEVNSLGELAEHWRYLASAAVLPHAAECGDLGSRSRAFAGGGAENTTARAMPGSTPAGGVPVQLVERTCTLLDREQLARPQTGGDLASRRGWQAVESSSGTAGDGHGGQTTAAAAALADIITSAASLFPRSGQPQPPDLERSLVVAATSLAQTAPWPHAAQILHSFVRMGSVGTRYLELTLTRIEHIPTSGDLGHSRRARGGRGWHAERWDGAAGAASSGQQQHQQQELPSTLDAISLLQSVCAIHALEGSSASRNTPPAMRRLMQYLRPRVRDLPSYAPLLPLLHDVTSCGWRFEDGPEASFLLAIGDYLASSCSGAAAASAARRGTTDHRSPPYSPRSHAAVADRAASTAADGAGSAGLATRSGLGSGSAEDERPPRLLALTPSQLLGVLDAFMRSGVNHEGLVATAMSGVERCMPAFTPSQLTRVAAVVGRFAPYRQSLMQRLALAVGAHLPAAVGPADLTLVLEVLARGGVREERFMAAVAAHAAQHADALLGQPAGAAAGRMQSAGQSAAAAASETAPAAQSASALLAEAEAVAAAGRMEAAGQSAAAAPAEAAAATLAAGQSVGAEAEPAAEQQLRRSSCTGAAAGACERAGIGSSSGEGWRGSSGAEPSAGEALAGAGSTRVWEPGQGSGQACSRMEAPASRYEAAAPCALAPGATLELPSCPGTEGMPGSGEQLDAAQREAALDLGPAEAGAVAQEHRAGLRPDSVAAVPPIEAGTRSTCSPHAGAQDLEAVVGTSGCTLSESAGESGGPSAALLTCAPAPMGTAALSPACTDTASRLPATKSACLGAASLPSQAQTTPTQHGSAMPTAAAFAAAQLQEELQLLPEAGRSPDQSICLDRIAAGRDARTAIFIGNIPYWLQPHKLLDALLSIPGSAVSMYYMPYDFAAVGTGSPGRGIAYVGAATPAAVAAIVQRIRAGPILGLKRPLTVEYTPAGNTSALLRTLLSLRRLHPAYVHRSGGTHSRPVLLYVSGALRGQVQPLDLGNVVVHHWPGRAGAAELSPQLQLQQQHLHAGQLLQQRHHNHQQQRHEAWAEVAESELKGQAPSKVAVTCGASGSQLPNAAGSGTGVLQQQQEQGAAATEGGHVLARREDSAVASTAQRRAPVGGDALAALSAERSAHAAAASGGHTQGSEPQHVPHLQSAPQQPLLPPHGQRADRDAHPAQPESRESCLSSGTAAPPRADTLAGACRSTGHSPPAQSTLTLPRQPPPELLNPQQLCLMAHSMATLSYHHSAFLNSLSGLMRVLLQPALAEPQLATSLLPPPAEPTATARKGQVESGIKGAAEAAAAPGPPAVAAGLSSAGPAAQLPPLKSTLHALHALASQPNPDADACRELSRVCAAAVRAWLPPEAAASVTAALAAEANARPDTACRAYAATSTAECSSGPQEAMAAAEGSALVLLPPLPVLDIHAKLLAQALTAAADHHSPQPPTPTAASTSSDAASATGMATAHGPLCAAAAGLLRSYLPLLRPRAACALLLPLVRLRQPGMDSLVRAVAPLLTQPKQLERLSPHALVGLAWACARTGFAAGDAGAGAGRGGGGARGGGGDGSGEVVRALAARTRSILAQLPTSGAVQMFWALNMLRYADDEAGGLQNPGAKRGSRDRRSSASSGGAGGVMAATAGGGKGGGGGGGGGGLYEALLQLLLERYDLGARDLLLLQEGFAVNRRLAAEAAAAGRFRGRGGGGGPPQLVMPAFLQGLVERALQQAEAAEARADTRPVPAPGSPMPDTWSGPLDVEQALPHTVAAPSPPTAQPEREQATGAGDAACPVPASQPDALAPQHGLQAQAATTRRLQTASAGVLAVGGFSINTEQHATGCAAHAAAGGLDAAASVSRAPKGSGCVSSDGGGRSTGMESGGSADAAAVAVKGLLQQVLIARQGLALEEADGLLMQLQLPKAVEARARMAVAGVPVGL